ncbi:ABC transporter permease [Angustibacter luteus]|uniref:ABC transporter permease n=1 Tax=Angustibacter luteus TaxID=658456 RepID=A0ABW1JFL9_9ACTN
MSPLEVVRSALRGLTANPLRSTLTTLGILIGVGAVIVLVAVGNGSSKAIEASIEQLGTNTLTVSSQGGRGFSARGGGQQQQLTSGGITLSVARQLTNTDLAPDVKSVTPEATTSATVTAGDTSVTVNSIVGTSVSYFEATNSPVDKGTYFTQADVDASRQVAVIGPTTADNLFSGQNPVGQQITVGNLRLTVVGVLAEKGSSGFQDAGDTIIAPITTVQRSLTGYGALSSVVVQATGASTVDVAESEVTSILDNALGVTSSNDRTYRVLNQSQLLSTRTEASKTFTVLLAAVAGISLLVGGIGITNIMLVTVTERTREIGIRKALGARTGAVLGQFLTEATALSLLGGVLGVAAALVTVNFTISGIEPVLVPSSIALALAVCVVIGVFFGGYPAGRAARLRPIDALRHE